jgi:signal transduction histidine kinase
MRLRPKLRTVLLIVNVLILLLPLGSIAALRIYETELVRRTESELLAQGVVIQLIYRDQVIKALKGNTASFGRPAVRTTVSAQPDPDGRFNPLLPRLDVAKEYLQPPMEPARPTKSRPGPEIRAVGDQLTPLLLEAQRATLAGIRVVDPEGVVVASTGEDLMLSLRHREEVKNALDGESVSLLYHRADPGEESVLGPLSRRTRYRVHVALAVVHENRVLGAVVLMRTPLDVRKAIYYHGRSLVIGALIMLAMVSVVAILISLTISRPIRRLIRAIDLLGRSEKAMAMPLDRIGTREVDLLYRAFGDMTRKLEERAEYLRAFVSNVSHAFKTPLASTRAAVELLQDHLEEMTAEERNRFMGIIAADTQRLERLVRRLTELARADVAQIRGECASVPELLADLRERYQAYGVDISLVNDEAVDEVAMDRDTLESILSNLFDNARVHGGSQVRVTVETMRDGWGFVALRIRDNGRGISEANAERIFRPFFTTAQDRGGSGLGLSIVQSLLRAHGGEIILEPSSGGATFFVRLPSA